MVSFDNNGYDISLRKVCKHQWYLRSSFDDAYIALDILIFKIQYQSETRNWNEHNSDVGNHICLAHELVADCNFVQKILKLRKNSQHRQFPCNLIWYHSESFRFRSRKLLKTYCVNRCFEFHVVNFMLIILFCEIEFNLNQNKLECDGKRLYCQNARNLINSWRIPRNV